mmetsp:Transcript_46649/g.125268  ORF Transcript_46649/g.125268 Transcript_46649/m.125268 type:complete len:338 (+) Transcript_46649:208-1221(+)
MGSASASKGTQTDSFPLTKAKNSSRYFRAKAYSSGMLSGTPPRSGSCGNMYIKSDAWQVAPLSQSLLTDFAAGSHFPACANMPTRTSPPVVARSCASHAMSHNQILSVIIMCHKLVSSAESPPSPFCRKLSVYSPATRCESPGFSRYSNAVVRMSSPPIAGCPFSGFLKSPMLSFLVVVRRIGTLWYCPFAINSRGSPGTMLPSTTGCQPRYPGNVLRFLSGKKPKTSWISWSQWKLPTSLVRSSTTQSALQILAGGNQLRQNIFAATLDTSQSSCSRMYSVRLRSTAREAKSAMGDCRETCWKRPLEPGETRCATTAPAPSLTPIRVTRRGSPPKA